MTHKFFKLFSWLVAFIVTTSSLNAEIVSLYNAALESEINGSDHSASVVNTPLVVNGLYNTRSAQIATSSGVSPHQSGVIPDNLVVSPNIDGHLYIQSAVTATSTSINQVSSPFHEFQITVAENQLNLDTLSFNCWATETSVNDPESATDYTYEVRALAEVTDATGAVTSQFANLTLTPNSGANRVRIQNPLNQSIATDSNNVVEFDLSRLGTLTTGQQVNFRLAFADYDTASGSGGSSGPQDAFHIQRLDNVQIAATSAVPEPGSLCLLLGGLSSLTLRRKR